MKYITVKLTEDQLHTLRFLLSREIDNVADIDSMKKYHAFLWRLIAKLAKAKN